MDATEDPRPAAPGAENAAAPRRGLARAAQVAAGLALGLAMAEGAFHLRDRGAFPHLNLYVSDAERGVRLRPGSAQKLAFAGTITSVRINREGLRGADLPPPTDGEILWVGDSQVFGLGVEEHETASAELGRILGGPSVINAGVPTYGPAEYNAVVAEMLAQRRIGTVVYVVNLVNDLFEAAHPNAERHVVWDGWAVRKETAPEATRWFPGREILYRQSHLVYAIRSYLHARGPQLDDRGFASEGTAADLVGVAAKAGDEHVRAEKETQARREKRDQEIEDAKAKALAAEINLEDTLLTTFGYESAGAEREAYKKSRDNPGDIVITWQARAVEASRRATYTATALFRGAELRREMEARIRVFAEMAARAEAGEDIGSIDSPAQWVEEGFRIPFNNYSAYLRREIQKGRSHPLVQTLAEREALQKRLEALRAAPAEIMRAWSPMTPHLRAVKAACDARGALLLVVALPMDVQVSPAEWKKYGAPKAVDMEPTKILIDDLVASAERIGASALDATPALAQAEPGAFLDGDIHMTPKGHKALAAAIAEKLRRSP